MTVVCMYLLSLFFSLMQTCSLLSDSVFLSCVLLCSYHGVPTMKKFYQSTNQMKINPSTSQSKDNKSISQSNDSKSNKWLYQ